MVSSAADSVSYDLSAGSCVKLSETPVGASRYRSTCALLSHCALDSLGKRVVQPTPLGEAGSPAAAGRSVVLPVPSPLVPGTACGMLSFFTPSNDRLEGLLISPEHAAARNDDAAR